LYVFAVSLHTSASEHRMSNCSLSMVGADYVLRFRA